VDGKMAYLVKLGDRVYQLYKFQVKVIIYKKSEDEPATCELGPEWDAVLEARVASIMNDAERIKEVRFDVNECG
jgi:hypothetical protein